METCLFPCGCVPVMNVFQFWRPVERLTLFGSSEIRKFRVRSIFVLIISIFASTRHIVILNLAPHKITIVVIQVLRIALRFLSLFPFFIYFLLLRISIVGLCLIQFCQCFVVVRIRHFVPSSLFEDRTAV